MNIRIQSFDNLHDNRVLRYCADFEANTLNMDTQTEAGKIVSVHFSGLLAHWFENVGTVVIKPAFSAVIPFSWVK